MKHKKAFSLVELLVGLIIISIALAAFAPALTRRASAQKTSLSSKLTTNCTIYGFDSYCELCYGAGRCAICKKGCADLGQKINVAKCVCEN